MADSEYYISISKSRKKIYYNGSERILHANVVRKQKTLK